MNSSKISAAKKLYDRDGVALLRRYIADEHIKELRAEVSERVRLQSCETGGAFIVETDRWRSMPSVRSIALSQPMVDLASTLLETDEVAFLQDDILVARLPEAAPITPWHQDLPYYPLSCELVSFWIPLDPVAKGTGLHLIEGSHRWARRFLPVGFDSSAEELYESCDLSHFKGYELWDDKTLTKSGTRVATWCLETGDLLAFSGLIVHGLPCPSRTTPLARLTLRYIPAGSTVKPIAQPWEQLELAGAAAEPGSILGSPLLLTASSAVK